MCVCECLQRDRAESFVTDCISHTHASGNSPSVMSYSTKSKSQAKTGVETPRRRQRGEAEASQLAWLPAPRAEPHWSPLI